MNYFIFFKRILILLLTVHPSPVSFLLIVHIIIICKTYVRQHICNSINNLIVICLTKTTLLVNPISNAKNPRGYKPGKAGYF